MRVLSAVLSQPAAAAALSPPSSSKLQPSSSPARSLALKSVLPSTHRQNDRILGNGRGLGPAYSSFFPTSPALTSSVDGLFEFICMGPLIKKLGFTAEKVGESIDKWILYGNYLCRLFQMNELSLTIPERGRIYHYYIPVFLWCEEQVQRHRSKFSDGDEIPPFLIGVSAPQGSGKTTLVFALDYLFRRTGRNAATLSIDDFYLTAEEQAKLRSQNPGNALLEARKGKKNSIDCFGNYTITQSILLTYFRGNVGSHYLQFSVDTLSELGKLTKEGMKAKLPRYDKLAYGGRGDRADPSTWPEVEGPLSVILFEG